ncbi:MAG: MBL fold metallo-hydrolase [Candidatus Omnitrophica bacterium]|nr:MBL fold metallo-hydrolase [Candidatus Omnitrophota bacterium]
MKLGYLISLALLLPSLESIHAAPTGPTNEFLGPNLTVIHGSVNGVLLRKNGKVLSVYGNAGAGPAKVEAVLLTDSRRDTAWAGCDLVEQGARAIVPAQESNWFAHVETFWTAFENKRFHDSAQQTTKVICRSIPVTETVRGGGTFTWEDISIHVLDTPGYTPGAVTYLLSENGKTVAFTGNLIYGDGQLPDLYSLQDAIPEANIGGYHGFAARLGPLLTSLRKVAAEKPDVLVPARGPIITNPDAAIANLTRRAQALYANYLSIDALRWYFGEKHIQAKAKRVLGDSATVSWMPMAETFPGGLPSWIVPIENSRLIRSSDGTGFLIDCGSKGILESLKKMRETGKLTAIDGLFITHYHDDHTEQVPALLKEFGCTVYASREMSDILGNPSAYRLPCLTANPILVSGPLDNGATWRWKEFELTAYYFPGQTLYHDALLIRKDGGESVFFIGDSFTPSGIDDYCSQNRNLLHPKMGYFKCLDLLTQVGLDCWLVNQHVEPAFRFSAAQISFMADTLRKRLALLRDITLWDDPNYALDEGWARFEPYGISARPGEINRCVLNIMNHSPEEQVYRVAVHLPGGWSLKDVSPSQVRISPRQEGRVEVNFASPKDTPSGVYLLTVDLEWKGGDLRQWTEALITITR